MSIQTKKPKSPKAKILIVDDHPVVRKGVAYLVDREADLVVCGECENGASVIPSIVELKPDAVLLDLSLKDINGIDLLSDLKKRFPGLPVLVLSMHDESLYAERVLRAGAKGYVSKDEMLEKVILALRQILQGDLYAGEAVKTKLLKKISRSAAPSEENSDDAMLDKLSNRELEVFQLLGQGKSTRQIAERWNRSVKTVETYRAHIKRKLNLTGTTELIHYAVQWDQKKK